MYQNKDALVLATGISALGVVRSLGLAGVTCRVITNTAADPVLRSRYTQAYRVVDNQNEPRVLEAIRALGKKGDVIIASSDYFIDILCRHEDQLSEDFRFVIPSKEVTEMLLDKAREIHLIRQLGIPLPHTVCDIRKYIEGDLPFRFPLLLKPRTYEFISELGRKNLLISTQEELEKFILGFSSKLDNYILQEIIPGADDCLWVCNCTFDRDSNITTSLVFNRWRTAPAHFGVTSFAISRRNPEIETLVETIGRKLAYVGPAMFEFKQDPRDGSYRYVETNPRLGMCNYFDTKCNANNAYATYQLALGFQPEKTKQQDGVVFLNFLRDCPSRFRDGESLVAILISYLRIINSKRVGAYWTWRDPMPSFRWVINNISQLFGVIIRNSKRR